MDRRKIEHFVKKNWIGLVILAAGFVSFAVVGVKAIGQYTSAGGDTVQLSAQEVANFKESKRPVRTIEKKAPSFKRTTNIKESNITGAWQVDLDNKKILLQMQGGQYKIVIIPTGGGKRSYSNGTYILNQDILMLTPDMSIPAPQSDYFSYSVLTRSPMPVMVTKSRGRLVFQRPTPEIDIYVPNNHALLSRTNNDLVVFDVLK